MTAIPSAYLDVVVPLIDAAREMVEDGQTLAAFAFVGNLTSHETVPVALDTDSEEAKDRSAAAIRALAEGADADFVFMIMEAWSLPPERLGELDDILERYGSIGASPHRVDVVSFSLETPHGLWVAQLPLTPIPSSAAEPARTFAEPEFHHFTEAEGRFIDLLPARKDANPSGRLH